MDRELLIDARWQECPKPIDRILVALELMRPGEYVRILTHREPLQLYPMLVNFGYSYKVETTNDGCFKMDIYSLEKQNEEHAST